MTPYVYSLYVNAYNERLQRESDIIEYTAWLNGVFTANAIMSTVGNSQWFKDKKTKAHKYPDNPLAEKQKQVYEANMSEEEKKKQTELLFAKLNVMKTNFDLAHK